MSSARSTKDGVTRSIVLSLLVVSVLVAGQAQSSVASQHESVESVAWSPDGKRIAWQTDATGDTSILWVARANGSHAAIRDSTDSGGLQLTWLPGGRFLWISGDDGINMLAAGAKRAHPIGDSIFQYSTDSRGTTIAWGAPGCPLCHGPVVVASLRTGSGHRIGGEYTQNSNPTLSPDGHAVVFTRFPCVRPNGDCDLTPGSLWLSSASGLGLHRIASQGDCALWAPDGKSILFADSGGLATMKPSGASLTTLVPDFGCNVGPSNVAWAPNSKSVAFWGSHFGGLKIVDVATEHVRKVTGSRIGQVLSFAWSPDSTRLLVAGRPTYKACASLWLVRADGAGNTLLRHC